MKGFFIFKKRKPFLILLKLKHHKFMAFIAIIFLIFILELINFSSNQRDLRIGTNYIFTFWEPRSSMPGYINLCIKTWKKNLPNNYKIIILDHQNLKDYLNYKIIDKIVCKQMQLPFQADAIRIAILKKYGGIWMDSDTIITNSDFINMFNGSSDLIMFGSSKINVLYTGFIYASKNSIIIKKWLNCIFKRIKIYKQRLFLKQIFQIKLFEQFFNQLLRWDYLSNGIINEIVKNVSKKSFTLIESDEVYALPEVFLYKDRYKSYKDFYFQPGDPEPTLIKSKGLLLLHNSWTEEKFKKMNEKEFIIQDILLARLLFRLLINDSSIANIKYKYLFGYNDSHLVSYYN